jgi:hypothetical protein
VRENARRNARAQYAVRSAQEKTKK